MSLQCFNCILKVLIVIVMIQMVRAMGKKATQKCQEYAKYVNVKEISPVLSVKAEDEMVSKCGIVETPLIIGGSMANLIEFPHSAAIGYNSTEIGNKYQWNCGGSVISEFYLLSAAHCENDRESGAAVIVILGVVDLKDNGPNAQLIPISKFTAHPKYQKSEKYNDIALIKLQHQIQFNEFVRPACLNTEPLQSLHWKQAIASGFGKTQYESDKGSNHLMKVLLSNIDRKVCKQTYQTYKLLKNGIIESQFCAGELEGKKVLLDDLKMCKIYGADDIHTIFSLFFSSCYGDSGSSLQIVMSQPYCMYRIIGVTSFGKFCGFANSPGVYTDVRSYIDFIEKTVWP